MLMNIAIGCVLIATSTIIHAAAMVLSIRSLGILDARRWMKASHWARVSAVAALVLMMLIASLLEAGVWAAAYLMADELHNLEEALYFSVVTYTSLGYGDITLATEGRLLAAIQSAAGVIMFGWTTAVIVAGVQRVYTLGNARGVGAAPKEEISDV